MKSNKYRLFFISLFLVVSLKAFPQEIQIGERCPDVELAHIINYPVSRIKLSAFKGKLVILDFWGTGCTACIRSFSHMESLQKKFGKKIQIVMVNEESEDSTMKFFNRMRKIKMPELPFVTEDKVLSRYFPHTYVPHHVWIDRNGIVRAITNAHNATVQHISAMLNDSSVSMAIKKDVEIKRRNSNSTFWIPEQAEQNGMLEYYSYLTKRVSGIGGSMSILSTEGDDRKNEINIENASLLMLYKFAFGEGGRYDFQQTSIDLPNSVILEVSDSSRFLRPKDPNKYDQWYDQNIYCYHLLVPPSKSAELFRIMRRDLERYFGVQGKIERRKIKCLVLRRTSEKDKIHTGGGKPATNFWTKTDGPDKYMRNQPFSNFSNILKFRFKFKSLSTPFVDATGYIGNVDINIEADQWNSDMGDLRKALKRYDLSLNEEYYLTDVLVLKDMPGIFK